MKKNIATILTFVAIAFIATSCKKKANEAITTDAKEVKTEEEPKTTLESYSVDTEASSIAWIGSKPTEAHNGTIGLSSGTLSVTDGKISSGNISIDMNSIVVLDIPADEKSNAKLVGHLKAPDFFNTAEHPTAAFEITGLTEAEGKTMLSGNLTLKEITHNVTFPITVTNEDDTMTLTSDIFSIDRTKWDIKFKSKTFFGDLGDKFIKDNIDLKVTLKAKK